MASEEFGARLIPDLAALIIVSATIQFHRELRSRTIKIENVRIERMLTSKFIAGKSAVPEISPKNMFGVGCFLAKQASTIHNRSLK